MPKGHKASPRILSVVSDPVLLRTRQEVLIAQGYDADSALPSEVDEKLKSNFHLVILSATLDEEEKARIREKVPAHIKVLNLDTLLWPDELLRMIDTALSDSDQALPN